MIEGPRKPEILSPVELRTAETMEAVPKKYYPLWGKCNVVIHTKKEVGLEEVLALIKEVDDLRREAEQIQADHDSLKEKYQRKAKRGKMQETTRGWLKLLDGLKEGLEKKLPKQV